MKLWKFCPGYVKIRIMGKYPERLVNRCISEGIALSDCQRCENGLTASVKADNARRLKRVSQGCGCRVRVVSRHGLLRLAKPVKRGRVFITAAAAFILAALWLSTRLWFISVESPVIPQYEIMTALNELGVRSGVSRSRVLCGEISRGLGADGRIVNAKVTLHGVRLEVKITAAGGKESLPGDDAPANVYAAKDCVISFISAAHGHAEAAPGQAVKKGDLLIRGDLSDVKPGYCVRAEGLILGEVLYRASATAPREKQTMVRSGKRSTVTSAELFGREFVFGLPENGYELELKGGCRLDSCLLPVMLRVFDCYELIPGTAADTEEGTEARAVFMAQEKLKELIPEDARIRSVGTDRILNGDGSVTAVITVTTIEKIGVTRSF